MGKITHGFIDLSCSTGLKEVEGQLFKERRGYVCDLRGSELDSILS